MGKKKGRWPLGQACGPSLKSFLLPKAVPQEGRIRLPFAKERTPARGWLAGLTLLWGPADPLRQSLHPTSFLELPALLLSGGREDPEGPSEVQGCGLLSDLGPERPEHRWAHRPPARP